MGITEGGIAIALDGVILTDNIVVIVVDILLLIVVAIAVVVSRGGEYDARRGVPTPLALCESQKVIEGAERAHTLHKVQSEALLRSRLGGEANSATQTSTRLGHRR